jgi:putative SbcD/Mre11-related phosphoesterase
MRVLDDWLLLPERFAVHVPTATAVLADVHLGYSAARQRQGDAIPDRSVREEMQPLIEAAKTLQFQGLVVAGDLFERGFDAPLATQFLDVLADLQIRFLGLVPGNHDRGVDQTDGLLPIHANGFDLNDWRIVHGDQPTDGENVVMGHWHPALRRRGYKSPCFLVGKTQLILPAFSLDAAGVDVSKDPRWHTWRRFPILGGKVLREKKSGASIP